MGKPDPYPKFAGRWPKSHGFKPLDVARDATVSGPTRRETGPAQHGNAVVTGPVTWRTVQQEYTGTAMGLATMHKSNTVPVFDPQHAIEIARMRRG